MINQYLLYKTIGERLRKARLQSGVTQSDLAVKIAHLRTSITNIEGGRQRVPLHVLYELCLELRIEVISILPLEEEVTDDPQISVTAGDVAEQLPSQAADVLKRMLAVTKPGGD
jgi:transcriptional regulator with XRE-family HTH domain